MSSITKRRNADTPQEAGAKFAAILLAVLGTAWAFLAAGNLMGGASNDRLFARLVTGRAEWTDAHSELLTILLTVAAVAVPLLWWADMRLFGRRRKITRAARHMATPWEARGLMRRARTREARRTGRTYHGLMLGYLARTRFPLFMGPEDTVLVITGPRQNKSSSIANPAIVEAPGFVLSTSNKPDPIYDTRAYRPGPQYIFDPQNLYAGTDPNPIYWNPLTYIADAPDDRKVERADTLAHRMLFAAGAFSGADKHWGNSAKNIVAAMMLAAALSGRTLLDVYRWVLAPGDTEPVQLLHRDGRFPVTARTLAEYADHPGEQRGGEYGTAQTALSFLSFDTVRPWITPTRGRTEFQPALLNFEDKTTLYVLSQEGEGSTGPLTAALTIAVYEAARDAAIANGGRLHTPAILVLDEVANVARWEALPDLYTHMGSRGILPIALLQNYSQGKHIWGEDRMKMFRGVASIFITGGNVDDNGFHEAVVNALPDYEQRTLSRSTGRNGGSTSVSTADRKILNVADLRALPKEYSIMLTANTPAILLRHHPIWRRRYKKVPAPAPAPALSAPTCRTGRPAATTAPSGWAVKLTPQEDG